MELLDLPNDCLHDICSTAVSAGISLAHCGESCSRFAQISQAERFKSFRFTLRSPEGDLYPWGAEKAAFVASEAVAKHVRHIAIERPAADSDAQEAGDRLLIACSRLSRLELTAFRPSDEAWQALADSQLQSLSLHAVTCDMAEDVGPGFANLRNLRVTFALPSGQQVLARCCGPLQTLSFRHFEAPDFTHCFTPTIWDTLVRLSLDCGISSSASRFVDLFESFREHRKSADRPLPLREVFLESRRLHVTGFSEIVTCLKDQPLSELAIMVVGEMPLEMLGLIAEYLPTLERLSMLFNVDGLLRISEWPHTAEMYADILRRMPKLEYFGMNHQCFTVEPPVPAADRPSTNMKEHLVFDIDWLQRLMGDRLRRVALYGLTSAQLGAPTEAAFQGLDPSLHYRGRLFERDEQGQIHIAGLARPKTYTSPYRSGQERGPAWSVSYMNGAQDDSGEPPAKKQRLSSSSVASKSLFAPFRALGHVSNAVPFALQVQNSVGLQKPEYNIISCLGRSWAMWGGKDMKIRFVGPEALDEITSLAVLGSDVFAAAGSAVFRYTRGRIVNTFKAETAGDRLSSILAFGNRLAALDKRGRKMFVWNTEDAGLHTTITFSPDFHASCLVHPATYLNKVLVGSREGGLQLWNVATCSLIYNFSPDSLSSQPSSVTAICQSPAVDIIALGCEDGQIIVYDVRIGEELFRLRPATRLTRSLPSPNCAVTSISFCTDNISHTLAAAYADGSIAVWDLDPIEGTEGQDDGDGKQPGRLLHVVPNAHDGRIGGLQWLSGQALLISSGADNSIKQWAFDTPTAAPRLLKSRSGHTAPPTIIRYYGDDGKAILSAGGHQGHDLAKDDRSLRYTSIVRDSRSFELSQGSLQKRAKTLSTSTASLRAAPIIDLHNSNARSRDWDDVVTCHAGESVGRTWTVENKRRGSWTFVCPRNDEKGAVAQCCHVTGCGNFGLIGFSDGSVGVWNMQSGIQRKTFDTRSTQRTSPVTGIACDALNRHVVASTQDGQLHKHQGSVMLASGISSSLLQRHNNLLAIVCDDIAVRIVDIESRRIVRTLRAFQGRIVDIAFSPDSRWLIAASSDAVVRTFDLPTGRVIDAFRSPSAITSLTFSPTGDFLATAHVDSVGVFLWANRAQFAEVSTRSFVREDDIPELRMPSLQGEDDHPAELDEYVAPKTWSDELDLPIAAAAVDSEMLQLSDQPRSKWQTLLNLDTIRARNKPKQPPKAPEQAPFFLPTLSGPGETRFDIDSVSRKKREDGANIASRLTLSTASIRSETVELLLKEDPAGLYEVFFVHLLGLSASALDLELRTLTLPDLAPMLRALSARLASNRDFEAVQAVLAVFLQVQGDILVGLDVGTDEESEGYRQDALDALMSLKIAQDAAASRLGGLVSFALGALGFVRGLSLA